LGNWRGFARTGFAAHYDHLVRLDGSHDLFAPLADRQVRGKSMTKGFEGVGDITWRTIPTPQVHVLHWFT
jgi:hypothetical protein